MGNFKVNSMSRWELVMLGVLLATAIAGCTQTKKKVSDAAGPSPSAGASRPAQTERAAAGRPARLELRPGDHIATIGNTLADRMQHDGWLETLIQTRFPRHKLVFRNLGFPADEINKRPRSKSFGSADDWLRKTQADVVFAFFGYNESFADKPGLGKFRRDLAGLIDRTLRQNYSGQREGESAGKTRLVLFSPIAHENLHNPNLPDGSENNARLALYTKAMAEVARQKQGVAFVDLFTPTRKLYQKADRPLTLNGVHLLENGNRAIAEIIVAALFPGRQAAAKNARELERLRQAVLDKNFYWFNRYRTVDGYNVYGGRSKLNWHGQSNADVMQREMEIFDVMSANRDRRVWAVARGGDLKVDDSNVPALLKVITNQPGEQEDAGYTFLGGEEAIGKMEVADGLQINLFASEEMFPDLISPVQMAVDTDGRLWVATWPSYPHWNPTMPLSDKIVILPDENRDGIADRLIVFADGLNSVTGFEFWGGGIIVAAAPELLFLKDTDGDDRADVKIHLLQGISSADSHHTANSFVFGPHGSLYYSRGIFNVTNMETPTKTFRSHDRMTGVYRFNPRTFEVDFHFPVGPNPHGDVFDQWGYQFANDGTSGRGYHVSIGKGVKAPRAFFTKRVRPVAATGILSSSHFPERYNGNFLVCNVIGFQGVLQHEIKYNGADITAVEIEPIVVSTDPNFRPSDIEIGGDGALYIADWHNPLIGHMQHNIRDPNRDNKHGRIYRVSAIGRPLLQPAKMKGKPIEQVLGHFFARENGTRYRARLELSGRDTKQVVKAVRRWAAKLDPADSQHEQPLLECLWVMAEHRVPDGGLLRRVLRAREPRVRAAATRTLGHWGRKVKGWEQLLLTSARDREPLVRAEAVVAASSFGGIAAAEAIYEVAMRSTDAQLDFVLMYARGKINIDQMVQDAVDSGRPLSAAARAYAVQKSSLATVLKMKRSDAVYGALLIRGGVPSKYRREALDALARKNRTSPTEELVAAIERQANKEAGSLGDLLEMLTHAPANRLRALKNRLVALATKSESDQTRAAAYAAWITTTTTASADGSARAVIYAEAVKDVSTLLDFLRAVPLIPNETLRETIYPLVRPLLSGLPEHLKEKDQAADNPRRRGVMVEYYGRNPKSADPKRFAKMKPDVVGRAENIQFDVPQLRKRDGIGLRFTATLDVPRTGKWYFFTRSDDGSRLYIDGKLIVNNDGKHSMRERRGKIRRLTAGPHQLVVTYFDNSGNDGIIASWQGPGVSKQRIPAHALSTGGNTISIKSAALTALLAMPGHEQDNARDFVTLLQGGTYRLEAIHALQQIDARRWSKETMERAKQVVLDLLRELANGAAQDDDVLAAETRKLGRKLALALPPAQRDAFARRLESPGVTVIYIKAVPHEMRYDITEFTVPAGKPVEIVFENPDEMPHNLLITEPGSLEEIGAIADEQVTDPKALARDYVPDSKKVLWATKKVDFQETARLRFTAPTRPGAYPYLCTYPGHWRVMNGVMNVTGETGWVVYDGFDGPGKGKHVVLVSGDEEYRSEEALPQLGKILAVHHGFTSTVLFAIDPDTGEVNPDRRDNIPGLEALETADLMIIATRFRDLPDEQMKRIDDYLKSGRPVIGMRTATHGFKISGNKPYAHYSNGYRGPKKKWRDGFGRLVLGEKWINHHGRHGRESARGIIAKGARNHPIVRGLRDGDVWGPSDVYGVRLPLSGDGKAIVLGQVLAGMNPGDPPVPGKKNNPMMPVGWTKTYQVPGGSGKRGRVFTTTMGASTDLVAAGTRRMLVNAVYWCLEMENKIPRQGAKVDIVGKYNPRPFRSGGFKKGVKPADHAIKR